MTQAVSSTSMVTRSSKRQAVAIEQHQQRQRQLNRKIQGFAVLIRVGLTEFLDGPSPYKTGIPYAKVRLICLNTTLAERHWRSIPAFVDSLALTLVCKGFPLFGGQAAQIRQEVAISKCLLFPKMVSKTLADLRHPKEIHALIDFSPQGVLRTRVQDPKRRLDEGSNPKRVSFGFLVQKLDRDLTYAQRIRLSGICDRLFNVLRDANFPLALLDQGSQTLCADLYNSRSKTHSGFNWLLHKLLTETPHCREAFVDYWTNRSSKDELLLVLLLNGETGLLEKLRQYLGKDLFVRLYTDRDYLSLLLLPGRVSNDNIRKADAALLYLLQEGVPIRFTLAQVREMHKKGFYLTLAYCCLHPHEFNSTLFCLYPCLFVKSQRPDFEGAVKNLKSTNKKNYFPDVVEFVFSAFNCFTNEDDGERFLHKVRTLFNVLRGNPHCGTKHGFFPTSKEAFKDCLEFSLKQVRQNPEVDLLLFNKLKEEMVMFLLPGFKTHPDIVKRLLADPLASHMQTQNRLALLLSVGMPSHHRNPDNAIPLLVTAIHEGFIGTVNGIEHRQKNEKNLTKLLLAAQSSSSVSDKLNEIIAIISDERNQEEYSFSLHEVILATVYSNNQQINKFFKFCLQRKEFSPIVCFRTVPNTHEWHPTELQGITALELVAAVALSSPELHLGNYPSQKKLRPIHFIQRRIIESVLASNFSELALLIKDKERVIQFLEPITLKHLRTTDQRVFHRLTAFIYYLKNQQGLDFYKAPPISKLGNEISAILFKGTVDFDKPTPFDALLDKKADDLQITYECLRDMQKYAVALIQNNRVTNACGVLAVANELLGLIQTYQSISQNQTISSRFYETLSQSAFQLEQTFSSPAGLFVVPTSLIQIGGYLHPQRLKGQTFLFRLYRSTAKGVALEIFDSSKVASSSVPNKDKPPKTATRFTILYDRLTPDQLKMVLPQLLTITSSTFLDWTHMEKLYQFLDQHFAANKRLGYRLNQIKGSNPISEGIMKFFNARFVEIPALGEMVYEDYKIFLIEQQIKRLKEILNSDLPELIEATKTSSRKQAVEKLKAIIHWMENIQLPAAKQRYQKILKKQIAKTVIPVAAPVAPQVPASPVKPAEPLSHLRFGAEIAAFSNGPKSTEQKASSETSNGSKSNLSLT